MTTPSTNQIPAAARDKLTANDPAGWYEYVFTWSGDQLQECRVCWWDGMSLRSFPGGVRLHHDNYFCYSFRGPLVLAPSAPAGEREPFTADALIGIVTKAMREFKITRVELEGGVRCRTWQDVVGDLIPYLEQFGEPYFTKQSTALTESGVDRLERLTTKEYIDQLKSEAESMPTPPAN